MIIPVGSAHVIHVFEGEALPNGAATTYGIRLLGGVFGVDYAAALHDAFADAFMPSLSSRTVLRRTLVKEGPSATGPTFEHGEDRAGGDLAGVATPQVAFLLRKRTAMGGRMNRGRMFLPGVPEGAVDGAGVVVPEMITDLQTACDAFLAAIDTLEGEMVILHSASSDPTSVISLQADSRVATQRRRLR